jgi:hypothetical protein
VQDRREQALRVFVAYGYNDRDRWIPEHVTPLVKAFGADVVAGEDLQGERITEEVQRRIENADALIGFRTRRLGEGEHLSHLWVEQELAYALGKGLKVVEVREEGISEQAGLLGDRQWIPYKETERERVLVALAETLYRWVREAPVELQLLPPDFVQEIRPLLRAPGFRCTYSILAGSRESGPTEATVRPMEGGLVIRAAGLGPQAFVQVSVEGSGRRWSSEWRSADRLRIELTPE